MINRCSALIVLISDKRQRIDPVIDLSFEPKRAVSNAARMWKLAALDHLPNGGE
jgi:hypothetical protein